MQVRLLSLLDAPYAFAATYSDSIQRPADHWAARARAGAAGGSSAIFLAHAPDGVVAMAGAFQPDVDPTTRRIFGVWVEPALRGQGLGVRLVTTLLDWAASAGAESTELWVTESNDPAVRLYESLGFEDCGKRQPMPSNPTAIERLLIRPTGRERSV